MSSEDLKKLQDNLRLARMVIDKQVEHEDAIIFNGNTKSGKSTLLNYLIGNKLISKRNQPFLPFVINKADDLPGPKIGQAPASETIFPTRWENQKLFPGIALWDSPGFDDNRGPIRDITNAYCIYELLQVVKSIKVVLVADIEEIISDKINPFLGLLHSLEMLLGKRMSSCFSSIVVVFTKVPNVLHDNLQVDKNVIGDILKYQIFSNASINISETAKNFVQFLIDNKNNIGLFKKPTAAGPITKYIDVGIIRAIKGADRISEKMLKESISPSIADKSKVFLYEVRQQLFEFDDFNKFQKLLKSRFDFHTSNYNRYSLMFSTNLKEHLSDMIIRVKQLEYVLGPHVNLEIKLYRLSMIGVIEKHSDTEKVLRNSKLMKFTDRLLNLEESQHFSVNLDVIIKSAIFEFNKIVADLKFRLNEIDNNELRLRIQKIKDELEQIRLEQMKKTRTEIQEINQIQLTVFGAIGRAIDQTIFNNMFRYMFQ